MLETKTFAVGDRVTVIEDDPSVAEYCGLVGSVIEPPNEGITDLVAAIFMPRALCVAPDGGKLANGLQMPYFYAFPEQLQLIEDSIEEIVNGLTIGDRVRLEKPYRSTHGLVVFADAGEFATVEKNPVAGNVVVRFDNPQWLGFNRFSVPVDLFIPAPEDEDVASADPDEPITLTLSRKAVEYLNDCYIAFDRDEDYDDSVLAEVESALWDVLWDVVYGE